MRYATALVLTGLIGAGSGLYTPTAQAGVYIGIGAPVPVFAPPVVVRRVVGVPVVPAYYPRYPAPYVGIGWRGPGWGYGHWGYHGYGYGYGYGHPAYGFHGGAGFHHR